MEKTLDNVLSTSFTFGCQKTKVSFSISLCHSLCLTLPLFVLLSIALPLSLSLCLSLSHYHGARMAQSSEAPQFTHSLIISVYCRCLMHVLGRSVGCSLLARVQSLDGSGTCGPCLGRGPSEQ